MKTHPALLHYYPPKEDLPDLSRAVRNAVNVPVQEVEKIEHHDTRTPPFDVVATQWHWLDDWGPLSDDDFGVHLAGAVADLGRKLSEDDVHLAYPMTHKPPVTEGVAYHDFPGPIDVRFIIQYGYIPAVESYGVTFYIVTLRGRYA